MHGEQARGLARLVNFVHGYVYLTLYDYYVKVILWIARPLVRRFPGSRLLKGIFSFFCARYHAKVLTVDEARRFVTVDRDVKVPPEVAKKVVPFETAYDIILRDPDRIAVVDCPCRKEKADPCVPLDVCLLVGRTAVDFVTTHMPRMHGRRISRAEAIAKIEAAHARGNVFTAWFKDATGGRTGVLCSCCACCCGGLEAMRLMRSLRGGEELTNMAPSGYSIAVDGAKCRRCGACAAACPYGAVEAVREEGRERFVYRYDDCMGCGVCAARCPAGARTLRRDEGKGVPLDVVGLASCVE